MKRRTRSSPTPAVALVCAAPVLALLVGAAPAAAQTYRAVDLTPPGPEAGIDAVRGGRGVGFVRPGFSERAALWDFAGPNHTDLHPSGFVTSRAVGAGGGQQVGHGWTGDFGTDRALLWRGSADSAVDLHPAGASYSRAHDTDGTVQVGTASFSTDPLRPHNEAILWRGSASGYVNLTPPGATSSEAAGANGGRQVGTAR